jgi:hypothetical protein
MSVQFGTIANGQNVSSAFQLNRANRALQLGVASCAATGWFLAFSVASGAPFARIVVDPALGGLVTPVFSGTNGAWAIFTWPPTTLVRVETAATVSATTSFALIEIPRYG